MKTYRKIPVWEVWGECAPRGYCGPSPAATGNTALSSPSLGWHLKTTEEDERKDNVRNKDHWIK